jgi:hypothetical protein
MKRRRRHPAAKRPTDLQVERDVATGTTARTTRSPRRRYSNLAMPHERDERTHRPADPNPVTEQALDDIEAGRKETDCYGAAGGNFDKKER